MKSKVIFAIGLLVLISATIACNSPVVSNTVSEFVTQTPDSTLTALFAVVKFLTPGTQQVIQITQPSTALPIIVTPIEQQVVSTITSNTATSLTLTPVPATATITPTPTTTSIPTTAAPLPVRSGGVFYATHLASPPVLDGNWDDWSTKQYSIGSITYGRSNWSGKSDLMGSFRIGWDNTNLYIAVKVNDDAYVQNASGADLYMGDSIDLLMDTDLYGDFYQDSLSWDDFQLGLSPGNPDVNGTREAFLWYPHGSAGSRTQVQIASINFESGYRLESYIPWSVLNTTPASGKHFGFAISISDNDNGDQNVQQTLASCVPNRHLTNPTTWGELIINW